MNEEPKIINQKVSSEDTYTEEYELVSKKEVTNRFYFSLILLVSVVSIITSLIFARLGLFN
jgi:hypothetical protein